MNASEANRDGKRERALMKFGAAMTKLSVDVQGALSALEEVKKIGGMELAVEAVAVAGAGAFGCMTKVVDASGRKAPTKCGKMVMQVVLTLTKHRELVGIVGASVIAAIVASKFAKR